MSSPTDVDPLWTPTVEQQHALEVLAAQLHEQTASPERGRPVSSLLLQRAAHVRFLHGGLGSLPAGYAALDASRPWLVFWILHSLALLAAPLPPSPSQADIIAFLALCQHPEGGFGGGPCQLAHLAPTYAAVAALVTLGADEALRVIDRASLAQFLRRMCIPADRGGGVTVHDGGCVRHEPAYLAGV
jgi:protein farnesyltransferase subunit beta